MEADRYITKLHKGIDATEIFTVEAVQLEQSQMPGDGNAVEIAYWVGGKANWEVDPEEQTTYSSVLLGQATLKEGQWAVKLPHDEFVFLTNAEFQTDYNLHAPNAKYICKHCLADTRKTQMSDFEDKCPECSSGYVGPPRYQEYEILRAAGMVLEEDE